MILTVLVVPFPLGLSASHDISSPNFQSSNPLVLEQESLGAKQIEIYM